MTIRRKDASHDKWEVLTVPFMPLAGDVTEGENLFDLGELPENSFRGMASVFGEVIDAFMPTVMQRGAFTKTIAERARGIPILWQHNIDQPIGKPTHLIETEFGLAMQATISRTTLGRDTLILIHDKVVNALSIGFDPVVFDFQEQEDGTMKRFIREARLHEVSVVTLGADPNALISEVRAGQVAGTLRKYWEGVEFPEDSDTPQGLDTNDSEDIKELRELSESFCTFAAEFKAKKDDVADLEIVEAFAATLVPEAEPDTDPLTLAEVEFALAEAELLAADLELESL